MTNATSASIPAAVQEFYNRTLLEAARNNVLHDRFGVMKPMPLNSGEQPKFRRYELIATQTEPLVEMVVPDPASVTKTDINGQLEQHGNYTKFSDYVTMTSQDKVLTELSDLMGKNAGDSLDLMFRDKLQAASSIYYANGVAAGGAGTPYANVTAKLSAADLRKIIRALKKNNAKPFKELVAGTDKVGTQPIAAAYFAIVDSYTEYDLKAILGSSFIPVRNYSRPEVAYPEEIGAFEEIRFLSSENAKVYTDAGALHVGGQKSTTGVNDDVHIMLIFGQEAYGVCPLGGKSAEIIVKALGSAGAEDPMNQYGTVAWKATTDLVILNDDFMYRYAYCVSE
jgi:N4-gp56 family major capsid protein